MDTSPVNITVFLNIHTQVLTGQTQLTVNILEVLAVGIGVAVYLLYLSSISQLAVTHVHAQARVGVNYASVSTLAVALNHVDKVPHLQARNRESNVGTLGVSTLGEAQVLGSATVNVGADQVDAGRYPILTYVILNLEVILFLNLSGSVTPLAVVALKVNQVQHVTSGVTHGVSPNGVSGAVGRSGLALNRNRAPRASQLRAVKYLLVGGNYVVVTGQPVLKIFLHVTVAVREVRPFQHLGVVTRLYLRVTILAQLQVSGTVSSKDGISKLH